MTMTAENFKIEFAERLKELPPYLFVEIDKAKRAAVAAKFLAKEKVGLYNMQDVLGLK